MLTKMQKTQLHKDLLEYLTNNGFPKTAEVFAEEAELPIEDVDAESNKLVFKWKSILSLQKKITNYEEQIKGLEEQLAKGGGGRPMGVKPEDVFIPKEPAKYQLKGHKGPITFMAFHPQYTELASASEDGTIKIWEVETGEFQRTLKGHTNPVNCVNFDPQGRFIVSSSSDLTIKLWDPNNDYQCCKTFHGHEHNVSFVDFVLGGDFLLSCSRDRTIRLWEVSTGYCKRTYKGHEGWVRRLAVSADSKIFASCSDDQSVIMWNMDKDVPVSRFFAHENVIENVLLVEGEQSKILMNSQFLKHKFTSQAKINALKQLEKEGSSGVAGYTQVFIMTASRDKFIRLFSQGGQLLHTFIGHDNWVRSLSLHSTGKYLYSASDDKSLRVWDLNSGKEKKRVEAHEHFISTVKFHNKYGVVATGGNDLIIKIWNLK